MRARTAVLASAVLAFVQARMIHAVLGDVYPESVKASFGVVLGQPHWRIYQSRVLGPYLVDSLRHVLPSPVSAFTFVGIVALFVAGLLACRLGNRLAGEQGAWRALLLMHGVFACLLTRPWLYIWDYLDLVVFLAFVVFVVEKRPTWWFAALCLVGMLNHEIAMFIGLWLVIDGVLRRAWVRAGVGVACVAAGLALIDMLRSALLIEETGPKIFVDAPKALGSSFYFTLPHNLWEAGLIVRHWDYRVLFLVIVFVFVLPVIAWWVAQRNAEWRSLALMNVAMLGSLLLFGILIETRIYIVMIPMLVLAISAAAAPRSA
ncbi:MAG: hypothetical protein JO257_06270 [Deltaproteobacteria bacterium]|nr:hypothetical protein [Deltaproteobacteria bacterium]